ncbi:hypothetical protein NQ315_005432 [Exocentrus adspersus]|uniref:Uncharacterized protein n=1 Tax=Exocentrus adspersus TaxID=1586481 RepID=A0AAV8V608_9CUCU|nr:hypothetical protein NQ315_005432 [Exocentrus adspersus]
MKCIILFLTLVALCYSSPYGTKYGYGTVNEGGRRNININEDGTIVITGADGKRIIINKGIGSSNQRTVDISVSGPNIPTKRIQINEQNQLSVSGQNEINDISDDYLRDKRSSKSSKQGKSQGETLTKILSGYQGDVDQSSYQQLLRDIAVAVQAGQLSSSVYDVLQSLTQGQTGYWGTQGVVNQRQGNVLDLLREQAIEQELQQLQLLQQQAVRIPSVNGIARNVGLQDVILDVPSQQEQIAKRISLTGPQGVYLTSGLSSGTRGLGLLGQRGVGGISYINSRTGGSLWEPSVRNLLTSYGQIPYGQVGQVGQVGPISQSVSGQLSDIIQVERLWPECSLDSGLQRSFSPLREYNDSLVSRLQFRTTVFKVPIIKFSEIIKTTIK